MRPPGVKIKGLAVSALAVAALAALAQSATIERRMPQLYIELASIGASLGYSHYEVGTKDDAWSCSDVLAGSVGSLEAKYFFPTGLGLGLTGVEVDFSFMRKDSFVHWPIMYVPATIAPSVSLVTVRSQNSFQYLTLGVSPYAFPAKASAASLSYSLVLSSSPLPLECRAHVAAALGWPPDTESGFSTGLGVRLSLGHWFMRRMT